MKIKNNNILKTGLITALTFTILSSPFAFASNNITLEQAKATALEDAGLKVSEVTFQKTILDSKNNEYDIEFYTSTKEYDYEIDATTGKINEKDNGIKKFNSNQSPKSTVDTNSSATKSTKKQKNKSSNDTVSNVKNENIKVTLDHAKSIALADAGLKEGEVTFHKTRLDTKDNEYDIEFYTSTKDYNYEIDATSGKINEKDNEIDKVDTKAKNKSNIQKIQKNKSANKNRNNVDKSQEISNNSNNKDITSK